MCERCLRAQSSCICGWIRSLKPAAQVLILQHPLEVAQVKGSGRLLHLSLTGSVLAQGEQFNEEALRDLLFSEAEGVPVRPVLLYPHTPGLPESVLPDLSTPQRLRLVILDATWRKSRKMLHLNPLLQALPRLPLIDPPASQYRIRKAHRADQLSTLEAACHALAQLESEHAKYLSLLQAFDGFVAQQGSYVSTERLNDPQA
ncbi:DTW domain-containing protein [Herbaspirillum sp. 3R11]|nr:tRNA-uridine aminocarboxypropyltransferase [Herbaspirillum sp. 3C11]RFB74290.1 DTW domain-containing protein [Herbaspirillum sp. 3R-3a1]TFI11487.1 DTW domain-containing protein [Herbaspirillum sp. 3R11]TFI17393.1 DTW domain-containing protein [Herbaspirillum sp. 3R-11]TFI19216.1 DTW domain-containing protein [Herbaspirillum sp. 3C11]